MRWWSRLFHKHRWAWWFRDKLTDFPSVADERRCLDCGQLDKWDRIHGWQKVGIIPIRRYTP